MNEAGQWQSLAAGTTNDDGRLADLLSPGALIAGRYRLEFATGEYFQRQSQQTFYPSVTIEFNVSQPTEHYHVPLLLSPFGYTTYRGS
jgi:5-hydroxyisourate hydrolase